MWFPTIILILSINICFGTWKNTSLATELILQRIRNGDQYDKNMMPLDLNTGDPLDVRVNMLVRNIHIDEKNMRALVDMTFRMSWKDYRLQLPQYPDVDYVQFNDHSMIWVPDPFFKSSTETQVLSTFGPESLVRVKSNGEVLLSARMLVKTFCPMDLSMFPHDSQKCSIRVASYGYVSKRMQFKSMMNDPIKMVKNSLHSNRFDISSYGVEKCDSHTVTGSYSCLAVNLYLKRTFQSYLLEWYIPCACFVVISFFSHLMPSSEVLARIVLTLTPLLALGVSTINYSSTIPSVPYSTAFDLFSGASLLAIFLSLFHVIGSYYYIRRKQSNKEATDRNEEHVSRWDRFKNYFGDRADVGLRMVIIGFYLLFLVIYFIEYDF